MSKTSTGWIIFIGAVGLMCSLMAVDIGQLNDWHEAAKPAFIGNQLAHLGVVIAAFVGGKIIPEDRSPNDRTRVSDQKLSDINQGKDS